MIKTRMPHTRNRRINTHKGTTTNIYNAIIYLPLKVFSLGVQTNGKPLSVKQPLDTKSCMIG